MKKIQKVLNSVNNVFSYVAMAAAFVLMIITALQVLLRNFTTLSIPGILELTELSLVLVVFLSIAYLQSAKGHIRVEIFLDLLPRRIRLILSFITYLLSFVIIGIMLYAGVDQVSSIYNLGQRTSNLQIIIWPFYLVVCVGLALYALTLLLDGLIEIVSVFKPDESASDDKANEPSGETGAI